MPAPESYRLDLGDGVVVAFVEDLSPEYSGRVAYVTHVPSGSQLVLDRYGQVVDRHDGREDGPDRLDGVLADDVAMEHIIERLQSDEDARPHESAADWVHSVQFDGITYLAKESLGGSIITEGERALAIEDHKPAYSQDELVMLTLTLTNTSDWPVTLDYVPPRVTIRSDQDSRYVAVLPYGDGHRVLQPHETASFTMTWDQMHFGGGRATPGRYFAMAHLANLSDRRGLLSAGPISDPLVLE